MRAFLKRFGPELHDITTLISLTVCMLKTELI